MRPDIPSIGMLDIPMVVMWVHAKQPVIRAHITPQIRVVGAGTMYHDAVYVYRPARFIAGVVLKK
jgi:hypothetical protein